MVTGWLLLLLLLLLLGLFLFSYPSAIIYMFKSTCRSLSLFS
jgi:hypothetical protein